MADDRGTDYVNQQNRELAQKQAEALPVVLAKLTELYVAARNALGTELWRHVEPKLMDIDAHVRARQYELKTMLEEPKQ